MKVTKKVFAALIAVMMIVMMIPFTASAAASNTLNWSCAKEGYTFSIYQIATLNKTTGKYTVTVNDTTLKNQIQAELKKVDSKLENGNGANATTIFKMLDSKFTVKTDAKISDVLGAKVASFATNATSKSGTVTLDNGLYYVVVLDGDHPANVKVRTGSVIALPYFSNDSNAWVTSYDATFDAKVADDKASVTKTIVPSADYTTNDSNTAAITDETTPVVFKLTASVVGSESQPVSFYAVGDKMSANLNYVDMLSATLVKEDGTTKDVTANFTKVDGDFSGSKNTYSFYFRYDTTKATDDDFYSYEKVEIQYNATVKDTVVVAKAEDNTDYLVYSQNPEVNPVDGTTPNPTPNPDGTEGTPVPPTPENFVDVDGTTVYVYTLGVDITKYDVNDSSKKPLADAIFGLYAADGKTILALAKSTTAGKDIFYSVKDVTNYEYDENDVYNVKPGTYKIKELVAPKGYSLNASTITVTVTGTPSATGVESGATNYKNGYFEYECGNSPLILPATGGAGTIMFTLVGASFIACAGLLLVVIKRKRTSK